MKKYVFLFILLFCFLLLLAFKFEPKNTFPLFGKLIILDPGHGGEDPGSVYKNEYEKDYNLDFARTLYEELARNGASVIMTRNGDYDLSSPKATRRKRSDFNNRIKLIDGDSPDLYLSLHMNYLNDSSYYGSQVFYNDINSKNEELASSIQKSLNSFFKYDKDYKKIDNSKYMYGKIKSKGVLIEFGFISSYKDRTNLKKEEYKIQLSHAIIDGIVAYFT